MASEAGQGEWGEAGEVVHGSKWSMAGRLTFTAWARRAWRHDNLSYLWIPSGRFLNETCILVHKILKNTWSSYHSLAQE